MSDHRPTALELPPIIDPGEAAKVAGAVWCDVRWYLDGTDGHSAYLADHIAGAIFVDLDRHLAEPPSTAGGRHPLPEAVDFTKSLGLLGIGPGDPVIAYDDRQGVPAGRLVWMLRSIGHEAALLDGGLGTWDGPRAEGSEQRPSCEYPDRPWPDVLADADATETLAQTANAVVIDARAGERYRGETEPMDARAGHVPGAINLPYADNLDSDGRFLPAGELRSRFAAAGIDTADEVVHYCGSGVSACHNLLAMERAGLGSARLYPGSWSAWSGDPERSVATGA